MMPPRPSATTSGTAPRRVAITGVPQAIDSIITRPNGSSHSIGKSVARASWSSSSFSDWLTSPRYSTRPPRFWCDILVEVLALGDVLILARELQRKPRGSRDLDRPVCPLLGAHAPKEEEVTRIVVSD